jgi:hypothetical protein
LPFHPALPEEAVGGAELWVTLVQSSCTSYQNFLAAGEARSTAAGGARSAAAGGARDAAAGRAEQFLFRASCPSLQRALVGAPDIPFSIAQSTARTKIYAARSILQKLRLF